MRYRLRVASSASTSFRTRSRTPPWATLQAGSPVNLEIDLIARYVERMLNSACIRQPRPLHSKQLQPH
jgi:hypothetical protein